MEGPVDADARRRRIAFRAWHRGTREMDLIMGRFADAALPSLNAVELDAFESLMNLPDPDLYGWVTGASPPPDEVDTPLFARLRAFNLTTGRADG